MFLQSIIGRRIYKRTVGDVDGDGKAGDGYYKLYGQWCSWTGKWKLECYRCCSCEVDRNEETGGAGIPASYYFI